MHVILGLMVIPYLDEFIIDQSTQNSFQIHRIKFHLIFSVYGTLIFKFLLNSWHLLIQFLHRQLGSFFLSNVQWMWISSRFIIHCTFSSLFTLNMRICYAVFMAFSFFRSIMVVNRRCTFKFFIIRLCCTRCGSLHLKFLLRFIPLCSCFFTMMILVCCVSSFAQNQI